MAMERMVLAVLNDCMVGVARKKKKRIYKNQ
jgi:hypothetical protein